MKENTKVLLEKNKDLLNSLLRLHDKPKQGEDLFDSMLDSIMIKPVVEKEDSDLIIKNAQTKELKQSEVSLLADLEQLVLHFERVWSVVNMQALVMEQKRFYQAVLPFSFEFKVEEKKFNLIGFLGDTKLKYEELKGFELSLKEPSVLRDVFLTENIYYGPLLPSNNNRILSAHFMDNKVCPQVIAIPVLAYGKMESIIFCGALLDNFSPLKHLIIKLYSFQISKILKQFSLQNIIDEL